MTKQSGMGDNLLIGSANVSGDINSLGRISGSMTLQDTTAIWQGGNARIGLLHDGAIDFMAYWNPGIEADAAHNVLSTLPRTDIAVTYCRGTALGSPAASMIGKQINYDASRPGDGSLTFGINAVANGYGLQWGRLATTGQRSITGALTETSVDGTAGTAHGGQLYIHVISFTGTSVYIGMDHSSDNGVGDAFTSIAGGALEAEVTAAGSYRTATAAGVSIERYTRLYAAGVFSQCTFIANFVRNETALP